MKELITVCGAGGFIGGHLVSDLLKQGFTNIRRGLKASIRMVSAF